jgi:hypothetical protein
MTLFLFAFALMTGFIVGSVVTTIFFQWSIDQRDAEMSKIIKSAMPLDL